jgi:DNA-binding response OmpR family regulator
MPSSRIVIVEDQHEVSRLLRSALETLERDFSVAEIPSGEEALLDSSRNPVDLLVADYRLPGISGIELMHRIRSQHPNAKIILITGQTDPRVRKEVTEAGADAFFIKPVPMADFLDAVERQLSLVEAAAPAGPGTPEAGRVQLNLPDLLAGLRRSLEAKAVLLISDAGRVLARAGDLPDSEAEVSLLSSLLSIFSASEKITRMLGQEQNSDWHLFDGGEYDLIFASAGRQYALLVIGEHLADPSRILKTIEVISFARGPILGALGDRPAGGKAARGKGTTGELQKTPRQVADQGTKDLEPLFKGDQPKFDSSEVDAFWNNAADRHRAASNKPDMLSYDQARQLGLTPEDHP